MDNIKFNKLLNEKYFLLKDIAQKYNYNEELLDMITYIYISFYMDFGKISDYPLYDLFNRVKIIYDFGTVREIAIKNNYFNQISSETAAITIFEPNLKVFQNPNLKQNPQTILLGTHVNEYLATPALKMEMLTHEVRHTLMGYYNTNILIDENTYYMRSGLQEIYYIRDAQARKKITTQRLGNILDEITNTYITELLVNRIMSFKKYNIENDYLKRYLNSIKTNQPDGKYRSIGYTNELKLLYPLLLNKVFIDFINQHQFDGEINLIKEFIRRNDCNYEEFCQKLDTIYENNIKYPQEFNNQNEDFICKHISDIHYVKSLVLNINRNLEEKRVF